MTDKTTTGITMSPDGLEFPDGSKIHADGAVTGPLAEVLAPMILRAAEALRKNLARAAAPAATAQAAGVPMCDTCDDPAAILPDGSTGPCAACLEFAGESSALSQQPVQAAGAAALYVRECDLDGTMPGSTVVAAKSAGEEWTVPLYRAAPAIAAPTAPIDLSKLTKWGAGMIAVGWQDDKELYVKVSDLERTLSAPTATAEPVAMPRELEKLRMAYLTFMRTPSPANYDAMLAAMPAALDAQPAATLAPQQAAPLTDARALEIAAEQDYGDEEPKCILRLVRAIERELSAGSAASAGDATQAARDVLAERRRQVEAEGWTPEHDDQHEKNEIARAAACYALHTEPVGNVGDYLRFWPWASGWWKPSDKRRNLIKAGALIIAEIERIDRAAMAATKEKKQ